MPALQAESTPRLSVGSQKQRRQRGAEKNGLTAMLVLVLLDCMCWTIALLLLSMHPNITTNRVMKTETIGNGSFWLSIELTRAIEAVSVFGLGVVLLEYLFLVLE